MRTAKGRPGPFPRVTGHPGRSHRPRIPGHIQKKLNGEFHGFDIPHIDNPDTVDPMGPGKMHLFPDPGYRIGVEPFIVPRAPNVVKMVIHSVASAAGGRSRPGQFPDVTPVVITEHQGHIVGNPHPHVIIILDLLVEGPHLGGLVGFLAGHLPDDLPLVGDDLLQQGDIGLAAHGFIAVATHPHRHQAFKLSHPRNT